MKRYLRILLLFAVLCPSRAYSRVMPETEYVLVEAESFAEKGGWCVDQQFMDQMGSPYLLAHGMGVTVEDAVTSVTLKKGVWGVWVRTYNWTSPWYKGKGPGAFTVSVGGKTLGTELGTSGNEWEWQRAGAVKVRGGGTEVRLRDLTGFDGRCDAVLFVSGDSAPELPASAEELDEFRRTLAGNPAPSEESFDFVVAGGGIAGICAAVTAARNGLKVALVNDRPVLGGNNSSEIRVHLSGSIELGPNEGLGRMIREFGQTVSGNAGPASNYEDGKKLDFVAAEENLSLFAPYHVTGAETDAVSGRITALTARHVESGREVRLSAPLFADCTGDGTVGFLSGADWTYGRESRDEYGESLAPLKADRTVMGASVMWRSRKDDGTTSFPEFSYGMEFNETNCEKVTMGEWTWETGMNMDQVLEAERVRDYGLLVIYSNWSWLKNRSGDPKFADRSLDWVAYVAGKRESRRLLGDYVLTQKDIDGNIPHPDASFTTAWSIDLHFPDAKNSRNFPGGEFKSATVHNWIYPHAVPYRCLYSRNVGNLFMAGRDISCSHVALGTVRVMRTTGMMGEVVGMAASICREHGCLPREVCEEHLDELKTMMKKGAGRTDVPLSNQKFNEQNRLLVAPADSNPERKSVPTRKFLGCRAVLEADTLRLSNSLIERTFLWNGGDLINVAVRDLQTGRVFSDKSSAPSFSVTPRAAKAADGRFSAKMVASDGIRPAHLEAEVSYSLGTTMIRRVFRIYDGCPAIACDNYVRETGDPSGRNGGNPGGNVPGNAPAGIHGGAHKGAAGNAADNKNIESAADMKQKKARAPQLEAFSFGGNHWQCRAVEFLDVTDWNNNLVTERDFIPYRRTGCRGNLLFARDGRDGNGFFILKEAPCSGVQLGYPGSDFVCEFGNFTVTGIGASESELRSSDWVKLYSCVIGVFGQGRLSPLTALRSYQKNIREHRRERDEMVMMNTWGDRSRDSKVNESFCIAELEKAARLGVTHFQIDDGWQEGRSPNSAVAGGSFKNIWDNPLYWTPARDKYPHGLAPVVEKAEELGIELGLWFNPSIQNDFADWEKDAEAVVKLHREYGISVFKIDGLSIPTKKAETNLRKFFDTVLEKTDNKVIFNLDVTAGRRGGYHFLNEYGNIFLENRYTDWGNWYPYQTLRNLWQLSPYVPAERIQVEFLNKWRNADKYAGDPFAPSACPFDYVFATAMAGQPLAWMEASNLPEEAYGISGLVADWRKIMADFHRGVILPIGDEPSGRSWTGFQSLSSNGEKGYVIVYRELNPDAKAAVDTWFDEGTEVSFTKVLGDGVSFEAVAGRDGAVEFSLPRENSFSVYEYSAGPMSAGAVVGTPGRQTASDILRFGTPDLMQNVYGRDRELLNGKWDAIIDLYGQGRGKKLWENRKPVTDTEFFEYSFDGGLRLNVPGDFNSQIPQLQYYEGTVWYARHFNAAPAVEGGRLFLYFGGVSQRCTVWLNGRELISHEGGFTPFQIDVTDSISEGDNFICIEVNNSRRTDAIPAMSFDWWNYGGITRDVLLVRTPAVYIKDYFLALDPHSGDRINVSVRMSEAVPAGSYVTVSVPELKCRADIALDAEGCGSISLRPENLQRWSPDLPKLYDVTLEYSGADGGSDRISEQIGFRTMSVDGTEILVNGKPVFMCGVSFHEEIPQRMGRACTEADAWQLLSEAKALGVNMVRLAHYPQNEYTVRLAERLGIILWQEIPVWQGIDFGNGETMDKALRMFSEMLYRDKNRCAVGFWGIANETRPSAERDAFLRRELALGRSLDPTRLYTAAFDNVHFREEYGEFRIDDELPRELDVVSFNKYMGWYAPWPAEPSQCRWNVVPDKPVIISEFGSEALYGQRGDGERASSWSEDYQADNCRKNIEMFSQIPNLAGVSPWILFDFRSPYRFHPTNQDGWNRKGLVSDQGQRKKAWHVMREYYASKRQK